MSSQRPPESIDHPEDDALVSADPPASDPEGFAARLDQLQQELERTVRERDEARDEQLRARAEFENIRKRMRAEQASQMQFANEQLMRDLLPVLDNLDRALATGQTAEAEGVRAGVELTMRMFTDVLARFGVKPIPAIGQAFDPALHEALGQVESADSDGQVVDELQRGYLLHSRVLRPSRVRVGVAPRQESDTGASS